MGILTLLLACSAEPEPVDTGSDTGGDSGQVDTADSDDSAEDSAPETAFIVVTNTAATRLYGVWYYDEWRVVDGVGLEPGATDEWEVDALVTGNLVYRNFETGLCWGASDLRLSPGEVVSFDILEPQGEERWHENDLQSCDFPGEG